MHPGDRNLLETWRSVVSACDGDIDDDGEVLLLATGSPLSFFNLALVAEAPADPERAVQRVIEFFDERDLDFLMWVSDRLPPGLATAAAGAGLSRHGEAPGMGRPALGQPPTPPPPGLVIAPLSGLDAFDRYMATIAEGFGVPLDLAVDVFRPALFERGGVVGLMGCVGDDVVSTSAMVAGGGVAGVYNVATPERFRGRGYGEALTWAAVVEGHRAGFADVVLQASSMGRPIYERMGFDTYCTYAQLGSAD